MVKVWTFWEGHKIWKNLPLKIWCYSVASNLKIFSNFVPFSECPNFENNFWGNSCFVLTLGWAPWNLSCLEFKFDDTRLSYWHKNKIGRIEIFFCCFLTLLIFCPVSWVSFAETSQQGRKLAKSGSNKKNFNSANLILMSIGKSGIIKFEFQTT